MLSTKLLVIDRDKLYDEGAVTEGRCVELCFFERRLLEWWDSIGFSILEDEAFYASRIGCVWQKQIGFWLGGERIRWNPIIVIIKRILWKTNFYNFIGE